MEATENNSIQNPEEVKNEASDKTEQKQKKGRKLFQKGQSGNPNGRPKGSISIKDKVRQYLESHPKDVEAIVEHFVKNNRELMWQMLEGRPQQDLTSGGKAIVSVDPETKALTDSLIKQFLDDRKDSSK